MQRPATEAPLESASPVDQRQDERQSVIDRAEPWNLLSLAVHQVVLRIGWIFKTESIIIPAFLDFVVPGGWMQSVMRGFLPVLNRLGQSVPPILFARRLKLMRRKKWSLTTWSLAMSLCFFVLSQLCLVTGGTTTTWMPWAFLALYGLFFASTGLNQLSMHTLQGKLIHAEHRGRLMMVSTSLGAPLAILAAWLFLGSWLAEPATGFGYIFGASSVAFGVASLMTLLLREPPDSYREQRPRRLLSVFATAVETLRRDANFRRLAVVAALFSTMLMMFPHYQAMGRERLGLSLTNLLLWVMVQNAATGVYSLVAGPIADRSGNRRVLRGLVSCSAITPLLATVLAQTPPEIGSGLFWVVFVPVGFVPVTIRTLMNYTLEIAPAAEHPRYVSTLSLCLALPVIILSPLLGLLVSVTSFEFVFLCGAAAILTGGFFTARLIEPRHRRPHEIPLE